MEKYGTALQIYRTTDKTITEICRQCGVSRSGFASYLQRHHRDLMYLRHGLAPESDRKKRCIAQKARHHAAARNTTMPSRLATANNT